MSDAGLASRVVEDQVLAGKVATLCESRALLQEAQDWVARLREYRGDRRAQVVRWVVGSLQATPTSDLVRHARTVTGLVRHLPEEAVIACYSSRGGPDRAKFWLRVEKTLQADALTRAPITDSGQTAAGPGGLALTDDG